MHVTLGLWLLPNLKSSEISSFERHPMIHTTAIWQSQLVGLGAMQSNNRTLLTTCP